MDKENIRKSKTKFNIHSFIFLKKIFIILEIFLSTLMINFQKHKFFKFYNNKIKIALCTMGRKENLYIKEFVDYYIKLGIDHIFIYDDNSQIQKRFQML